MDIDDRFIAPDEAARLLGIKTHTLAEWRRLKKGPEYVRINDRTVRYNLKKLRAWIDSHIVKSEEQI